MKQTHGKLSFSRLIFLILFLTLQSFAGVKATVNAPAVYEGDIVNYTITADGKDILFPELTMIADSPVIGTSSSESITMVNSQTTHTTSKTYSFRASKSSTIPKYKVVVDGEKLETNPVGFKVLKPTASQNGAPFVLEMQVDKQSAYVGEPINLTIAFKRKLNASVDKVQLDDPKLDNFWVKKVEVKDNISQEGEYIVEKIYYKLFPQKAGEYHIPSLVALVGQVSQRQSRGGFFDDPFFGIGQSLNWKKIYSNEITLQIKPLPNGLELYGKYTIEANVDKKVVPANKPVNLNIVVKGEGNIDDVKKFEVEIPNVIVYADEPQISSEVVNGVYQGVFRQKIALIADANFTIPSLSLDYFDKETQQVKTVKTEPMEIEVKGGNKEPMVQASSLEVSPSQTIKATPSVAPKTEVKVVKEDAYLKYLFLGVGFILGLLMMLGVNKFNAREVSSEVDIVKAIRKAKDDKALFNLLLPYAKKHKEVAEALNKLEKNIYKNGNEKIDREILMELFE